MCFSRNGCSRRRRFADPQIRAAAQRLPRLVLAGACLPDLALAGRALGLGAFRRAHQWSTLRRLAAACWDEERAIAVGYASHLLADVVAHNRFVPEHERRILDVPHVTHALCEWAMDRACDARAEGAACRSAARGNAFAHGSGGEGIPLPTEQSRAAGSLFSQVPNARCGYRACRCCAAGPWRCFRAIRGQRWTPTCTRPAAWCATSSPFCKARSRACSPSRKVTRIRRSRMTPRRSARRAHRRRSRRSGSAGRARRARPRSAR